MKVAQRFGAGHRVLVTGGAGFVPSHLVDALIARGCTVVAVDNFVTGAKENVAHLADNPRFTLVEADVSDGAAGRRPGAGRAGSTRSCTSPRRPARPTSRSCRSRSCGSARSARCTCWSGRSPTAPGSCWPPPPRRTATRWCTRSRRPTGATSTRSACAASTTSRSASPRRRPWPTTATAALDVGDRADLQHVRPADAPGRRPGHPDVHHPGAARRADHRARHRRADPVDLLRRRPGRGASCCCSTRPRPARSTAAPSTR